MYIQRKLSARNKAINTKPAGFDWFSPFFISHFIGITALLVFPIKSLDHTFYLCIQCHVFLLLQLHITNLEFHALFVMRFNFFVCFLLFFFSSLSFFFHFISLNAFVYFYKHIQSSHLRRFLDIHICIFLCHISNIHVNKM